MVERRAKIETMIERIRKGGVNVDGGVKLVDYVLHRFILYEATAICASYLVIGSHGHGRLFELVLGSVTAGVVRDARIPVVVVPARA